MIPVANVKMKTYRGFFFALGKTLEKGWTALSLVLTACHFFLVVGIVLMTVGIAQLGNGYWLFQDDRRTFRIRIDYGPFSYNERLNFTVRDIWLPTGHAISPREFRFSMQDFLQQFKSLPQRWGWEFEALTEYMLHSSAQFQQGYFTRSTLVPVNMMKPENLLIASALRCLVILNEIGHVTSTWRPNWTFQNEDDVYTQLAEPRRDRRGGCLPSVEMWKLGNDFPLPKTTADITSFSQTLRRTVSTGQQVLYRGQPQDCPYIFYVLCILMLVHGGMGSVSDFSKALEPAAEELKDSLYQLCSSFYLITDNIQPLRDDLDIECYSSMVDDNELAVRHNRRLNKIWVENVTPDVALAEDIDGFWEDVDNFALGMIHY